MLMAFPILCCLDNICIKGFMIRFSSEICGITLTMTDSNA